MVKTIPKSKADWTRIVVCFCAVLTLVGSAFVWINATYAKATTVQAMQTTIKSLNKRLDVYILTDIMSSKQERVWRIEDRYQDGQIPLVAKEEIRRLRREIQEVTNKIDSTL